jgi:hypothetical protein
MNPFSRPHKYCRVSMANSYKMERLGRSSDIKACRHHCHGTLLDADPIVLIQTVPGLMNVIQYLDARRAVV